MEAASIFLTNSYWQYDVLVKRVDLDVDVDFIFTSFKTWNLSIQFAIENFLNRSIGEAKHINYLGFLFFRQYLLFTIQH